MGLQAERTWREHASTLISALALSLSLSLSLTFTLSPSPSPSLSLSLSLSLTSSLALVRYASEVTRTQLPSLKRRLAFFAFLLPTISLAHAPRRLDSGLILVQQGLSIIAPAVLPLALG